MNITNFESRLWELSGPRPPPQRPQSLRRVRNPADLGWWHPSTTYSHLHVFSSCRNTHSLTELVGQTNFVVGLHPLVVGVGFGPQDTSQLVDARWSEGREAGRYQFPTSCRGFYRTTGLLVARCSKPGYMFSGSTRVYGSSLLECGAWPNTLDDEHRLGDGWSDCFATRGYLRN